MFMGMSDFFLEETTDLRLYVLFIEEEIMGYGICHEYYVKYFNTIPVHEIWKIPTSSINTSAYGQYISTWLIHQISLAAQVTLASTASMH